MRHIRDAHARSRVRLLALSAVILLAGLVLLFYYQAPVRVLLRPDYWTNLLNDRGAAASILGSVLGGILTISAGLLTVLFYRHQQRDANWTNFFKWLTDFHTHFHRDPQFADLRLKLASQRPWIRRQLSRELLLDGCLGEADMLAADRAVLDAADVATAFPLDWVFLREFTDYLYFFEQILIFGETLYYVNSAGNASVLVDHFGWFLRSLFVSWDEGAAGPEDVHKARRLFVLYLANNRYLRLTSVALVFMQAGRNKMEAGARDLLFVQAKAVLVTQGQVPLSWASLRKLDEYWLPIVGPSGFVAH
jgi:hypothetical protein